MAWTYAPIRAFTGRPVELVAVHYDHTLQGTRCLLYLVDPLSGEHGIVRTFHFQRSIIDALEGRRVRLDYRGHHVLIQAA